MQIALPGVAGDREEEEEQGRVCSWCRSSQSLSWKTDGYSCVFFLSLVCPSPSFFLSPSLSLFLLFSFSPSFSFPSLSTPFCFQPKIDSAEKRFLFSRLSRVAREKQEYKSRQRSDLLVASPGALLAEQRQSSRARRVRNGVAKSPESLKRSICPSRTKLLRSGRG